MGFYHFGHIDWYALALTVFCLHFIVNFNIKNKTLQCDVIVESVKSVWSKKLVEPSNSNYWTTTNGPLSGSLKMIPSLLVGNMNIIFTVIHAVPKKATTFRVLKQVQGQLLE